MLDLDIAIAMRYGASILEILALCEVDFEELCELFDDEVY